MISLKKILPIIVVIAALGIGAYSYFTGGTVQMTGNGISISKTITSNSETFTGDLKAAVARGVPMKCTFKNPSGMEGVGYIKDRQYFGEIEMNGKSGYIIMQDNCTWTWDKDTFQGAKMCFDGDMWASGPEDNTTQVSGNYSCKSDNSISDDLFTIPTNVKFYDTDNPTGMEE